MIVYLLKSATCLALLLAFYHLVLEREKMYNFNRFYLLGSILFSFLAPLYVIYIDMAPLILKETPINNFENSTEITPEIIVEKSIDYTLIIIGIYSLISSIFFLRFGKNLFHIIQKIRKNKKVNYQKAVLVLVDDKILPHTFWNYIFINKNDYENQKIEQELFTHELTHVTQKHTLDVLFLEFLQAIFWINPFFILLKKAVQLNHEFLADETVINLHKNTTQYQHLLLNKAAWKNDYYLASNLNYSLTKKRLKMMTTQSSRTKIWLKKLAVVPLLAGFIFLFAERVEAQEVIEVKDYIDAPINDLQIEDLDPKDIRVKLKDVNNLKISYTDKDTIIEKNKASEKQMNEYKMLLNEGKKHNIYKLKNIKKMQSIYSLMSEKQKNGVQNISEIIPPPPPPIAKTSKQKVAKSDKIRETIDSKKDLNEYKKSNKNYEAFRNKKPHYIDSDDERKETLENSFSDLGSRYFNLSKEDKKKAKRPVLPQDPYIRLRKNNKVFYKLRKDFTEEDKLLIPPPPPVPNATKEEIEKAKNAYEAWKVRTGNDYPPPPPPPPVKKKQEYIDTIPKKTAATELQMKKYESVVKKRKKTDIFKVKEINKIKEIYTLMSDEQKKSVINVNDFIKTIPILTPKIDWVFTYKRLANRVERTSNNRKANLIYLKEIYNTKMSDQERAKVTAPDKISPPTPSPTEEQKNQETQLNKYLKLSENYIGNESRTKKELEEIKKQYALLDESIKSNFMSPDYIIKNMKVLEAKHKIMMNAKQKGKVYKLSESN